MPEPEFVAAVDRILAAVAVAAAAAVATTTRATTTRATTTRATPRPPIVLIDGFSGAGKSTLADALVACWTDAQLVRLEFIYPGWDGLEAASSAVRSDILEPLSTGEPSSWRRWDWEASAPAERHPVDPGRPLVIEGAGALSAANHRLATLGVWVDLDEPTRRLRALARDGDAYLPHWERWAEQERAFARRERPRDTADLVFARHDG